MNILPSLSRHPSRAVRVQIDPPRFSTTTESASARNEIKKSGITHLSCAASNRISASSNRRLGAPCAVVAVASGGSSRPRCWSALQVDVSPGCGCEDVWRVCAARFFQDTRVLLDLYRALTIYVKGMYAFNCLLPVAFTLANCS